MKPYPHCQQSASYQSGLSMVALLIILLFVGIAIFQILKLSPSYIEGFSISSHMKELAGRPDGIESLSNREIRSNFSKFFTVNGVSKEASDSLKVSRQDGRVTVDLDYERRVELFYNIDIVMKFHYQLDSKFPGKCCKPRE